MARKKGKRSFKKKAVKINCNICLKEFATNQGLGSHLKTHTNQYLCDKCCKTFHSPCLLKRHIQTVHEIEHCEGNTYVNKCGVCNLITKKNALVGHYKKMHDISIEEEIYKFKTKEEFWDWKDELEKCTVSTYVQRRYPRINRDGSKMMLFNCHRDGYFHIKGSYYHKLKLINSNKINSRCPSVMNVKETDSSVFVHFVKTHAGHSMDLGRLTLTRSEKNDIAQKLNKNISVEEILNDVRGKSNSENITRLQLLDKRDIYDYEVNEQKSNVNDYGSLESVIENIQLSSPQERLNEKDINNIIGVYELNEEKCSLDSLIKNIEPFNPQGRLNKKDINNIISVYEVNEETCHENSYSSLESVIENMELSSLQAQISKKDINKIISENKQKDKKKSSKSHYRSLQSVAENIEPSSDLIEFTSNVVQFQLNMIEVYGPQCGDAEFYTQMGIEDLCSFISDDETCIDINQGPQGLIPHSIINTHENIAEAPIPKTTIQVMSNPARKDLFLDEKNIALNAFKDILDVVDSQGQIDSIMKEMTYLKSIIKSVDKRKTDEDENVQSVFKRIRF